MGTDIYLRWDGFTASDPMEKTDGAFVMNGRSGYLRSIIALSTNYFLQVLFDSLQVPDSVETKINWEAALGRLQTIKPAFLNDRKHLADFISLGIEKERSGLNPRVLHC